MPPRLRGLLRRLRALLRRLRPVRYDAGFFGDEWHRNWAGLAPVLGELLTREGRWKAFLDYGCGPGLMIDVINERGYSYVGCDVSPEPRRIYLERYGRYPGRYVQSLAQLGGMRFDVLVLFDVLEHLRDAEVETLLAATAATPEVLANISRERGIPGHVNIKGDAGWIEFFGARGYEYQESRTQALRRRYLELRPDGRDLWHRNLFLFRRRAIAPARAAV
jgi:SAM-dependent methyltransferase